MAKPRDRVAEMRENLADERSSAWLYGVLATAEEGRAADLFARLRTESEKQAEIWAQELKQTGVEPPSWRPGLRAHIVGSLVRHLGPRRMLPVLSGMKVRGLGIYRGAGLAEYIDRTDGALVSPVASAEPPVAPAVEESWHRAARGGGALRAAVFGVNDGLVSNASLIFGMAGANVSPHLVIVAGTAGLLAGGFSMATGEYISVRTQRELLEYQLELERRELETMPEEEIAELTLIYEAKGIEHGAAAALARRMVADPKLGLATLAREELGLDPLALASPVAAAVSSFVSFCAGAFVPLIPWLASGGPTALIATVAITLAALLSVGALMSLLTGRRLIWSALRMALLGAAAAAATYAIGRLLGVSVS